MTLSYDGLSLHTSSCVSIGYPCRRIKIRGLLPTLTVADPSARPSVAVTTCTYTGIVSMFQFAVPTALWAEITSRPAIWALTLRKPGLGSRHPLLGGGARGLGTAMAKAKTGLSRASRRLYNDILIAGSHQMRCWWSRNGCSRKEVGEEAGVKWRFKGWGRAISNEGT